MLEADENLVGFVHLRDPELVGLFVDPDVQRCGYGSELFRFAVQKIRSRPVILDATLNAINFYLKRGCVPGPMKSVRRNDRDIYVRRMEFR